MTGLIVNAFFDKVEIIGDFMKSIYIIPARMGSSRLHEKVIKKIGQKTLIEHVISNFERGGVQNFLVACDDAKIGELCEKHNVRYILTDPDLPSGTDRVYAAYKQMNEEYDCVINVQGDLAVFNVSVLKYAIDLLATGQYDMTTIGFKLNRQDLIESPDTVKIAIAFKDENNGQALYFSRNPIPHAAPQYYQHVGVYAYKPDALEKFVRSPIAQLEKIERLEQLRVLENGMKIGVSIVPSFDVIEVNNQKDADEVAEYTKNHNL